MIGEYKLKQGALIFIYTLFGGIILTLIAVLCRQFFPDYAFPTDLFYGMLGVFAIIIVACLIGIMDARKSKLTIDKNSIQLQGLFGSHVLDFNDIQGIRLIKSYIYIIPVKGKKQIRISYFFEQDATIYNWLIDRFGDIDEKEAAIDTDQILHNEEFGAYEEDREARLKKAKRQAKILNWIGSLAAVWLFFAPTPYKLAIAVSLIYFPLALIVLRINKGIIRLSDKKSSGYPSIGFGVLINVFALLIRSLQDNQLMEYTIIWQWTGGLSLLLTFLYVIENKGIFDPDKKKRYELFLAIIAIGIYSYSALLALNSTYDSSKVQIFQAKVLDKRIISGKTTSYCLQIGSWGNCTSPKEINVNEDFYNACTKETIVDVYYMNGLLNIPWIEVYPHK